MTMATRIVEECRVAPSPGAPDELLLKLLHFDMVWLPFIPLRYLFFYEHQCSESHFLNTIVPNLKASFSLTLKHFIPFAGKLLIPRDDSDNSRSLVFRYVAGEDSVPLIIAISNANLENLTANHSVEAGDCELDALVPHELPPPALSPDSSTLKLSLTAFQVTLFPNKGVCIGVIGNHSLCDGATTFGFLQTWASINRSNGDSSPDLSQFLPSHDRDTIADSDRLAVKVWEAMKAFPSPTDTLPTDGCVRATVILSEACIKTLKSRAIQDGRVRVSSLVVACAHLWACLGSSAAAAGEEVSEDEAEYLTIPVDCRRRLNPPLPDTYFGNCVAPAIADTTNGILRGRDGFLSAVKVIGESIRGMMAVHDTRIMDDSAKSLLRLLGLVLAGKRMVIASGIPGLDLYATDYGWGRAVKIEALNRNPGAVIITNSREYRRGMEIRVFLPKPQMHSFGALFSQGLPTEKLWCKM